MTIATLRTIIGCVVASMAFVTAAGAAGSSKNSYKLLEIERQTSKWYGAKPDDPVVLNYAYVDRRVAFKEARNCKSMQPINSALEGSGIAPDIFRREAERAFAIWEEVAQVKFVETSDLAIANIIIGAQTVPRGRAFTNVELDEKRIEASPRAISRSLICFNPQVQWKVGYDGDLEIYDLRYTMAHEIGHALGLDHPGASGQLMGYRYDERHQTLQSGDIDGILQLYKPTPHAASVRQRAEIEASRLLRQSKVENGRSAYGAYTGSLGIGAGRASR